MAAYTPRRPPSVLATLKNYGIAFHAPKYWGFHQQRIRLCYQEEECLPDNITSSKLANFNIV